MADVPSLFFDKETVKAQKCAAKRDWDNLRKLFEENKRRLLWRFDIFGNTVIHVVARSGNAALFEELLKMLPESELSDTLRMPNLEGNTLLHEAVLCENTDTVDVIMEFGEKKLGNGKSRQLLEIKNQRQETPVFRAAKHGKLKMLKHLHVKYTLHDRYFSPRVDHGSQLPILHNCLLMFNPVLPDEGYLKDLGLYDPEDETLNKDIESGHPDDEKKIGKKAPKVLKKLNFSVWNWLRTKKVSPCIENIWNQKKNHTFAEKLAKLLVEDKEFWYYDYRHSKKGHKHLNLIHNFSSNITDKKNEIELKHRIQKEEEIRRKINTPIFIEREKEHHEAIEKTEWEPPILLAAASGIIEVVKIIYNDYPAAIFDHNTDGLNILHLAIRHRQREIYEFIKKCAEFPELTTQMCNNGGTILHEVGCMDYYREPAGLSVAYQLKVELQWYRRVKKQLPKNYIMHCDHSGLTAEDLFNIEHADMHEKAKKWMKETAQSCSTVAVLIAGAVFAAAYGNTPGGTDNGKHHKSSTFQIFTTMDVMALASSLLSVAMFLSIHTSSFDLWDFRKTLTLRLNLGFTLLFLSFITSLSAFASTVSLSIGNEGKGKQATFIYSLAFLIVSVVGLTQFRLHKIIPHAVLKVWKRMRQIQGSEKD